MAGEQIVSCAAPERAVTVAEARQRILALIAPLAARETVRLPDGLHRVTALPIRAPIAVPPYDNSAMDGYAVRSADLPAEQQCELQVVGTALAGAPYAGTVGAGECVRIMTGAMLPAGADTVVMQEEATQQGDASFIAAGHRPGNHVRYAGEDLTRHDLVIAAGKRLTPADLGVLASLGIVQVEVVRRPRVAFFSTGDELKPVGEPLTAGALYDSNRYTVYGLLTELGADIVDLGIVPARREALRDTLLRAAAADFIISTGGVSVGDADFVRETLGMVGEIHFWRVGMKPGRPFAFGRIDRAWFFGLPGNPVSTIATFLQFVQPALRRLMGEQPAPPFRFKLRCVNALKKVPVAWSFSAASSKATAKARR